MSKKTRAEYSRRREHEAEAGLAGAVAGAAMGAIAGPPGAVAGAVVGGIVGVLAGVALENQSEVSAEHDTQLDEEIGVAGGDLGAPNLAHPPAVRGAFSAASSATNEGERDSAAEGPMQTPGS